MELHVWGTTDQLAILDADCLAATWYMALAVPHTDFTIVTSSNTDLSSSGRLPVLTHSEGQADGFLDIIRFLRTKGYDLAADESLTKEQTAINYGLLMYVQDKLELITEYTLYLNKDNYEKYTRSIYSLYLPFPMQYNTPLQYRSHARANCARIGLKVEDKTDVEEEMLKNVPTVSKVQQLKHDNMIEEKLVLKNSVTNMKCINQLQESIRVINQLQLELGSHPVDNIFSTTTMTSSDLLLLAHLYIITHKDLPDQFIRTFLQRTSPEILARVDQNLKVVQDAISKIQRRGPTFWESPNIVNAVRHLVV